MFSSTENNSYPLSYHLSPSLTIPESNNTFLLQQPENQSQNTLHESFIHLPFSLNPTIGENPIINNIMSLNSTTNSSLLEASITQENTIFNCPLGSGKKPPPKKDRHTKICTAQGLRDRRVRLSINIAREFFSLQDLLGFDKASKTLGWLLSKSKAAIDELVSSSRNKSSGWTPSSSSAAYHQGEVLAQDVNEDEDEDAKEVSGGIKPSSNKKRDRKLEEERNGKKNAAREIRRAKARERARERTNKKKMIMIGNDDHNNPSHHQRAQQNLMIHQSCSGAAPQHSNSRFGMCNNSQQGMMISVGGKNKLRSTGSSSYNYNCDHQMMCSRLDDQESFNNDYQMKLALESNGGIIRAPGFSALNIINLSTEIHINAKPWEIRSNP